MTMRTIDLFAGCGGLSLGLINAGFDLVAAVDNWDAAAHVYADNFTHPIHTMDLATAKADFFQELAPDIIVGGPPCQDYSSAGKRDETLGRADLTVTFAELVAVVRPAYFIMENVERIAGSRSLQAAKKVFKDAGYGLSEEVLNAAYCGVPQYRKRYFLVGEADGADNALNPYLKMNLAGKPMTVYDYLGDSLGIQFYYRHPRSYARRAIFSIHEPSPTVRGVNRPIPETYKPHPGDAAPITSDLRPLTTLERSYLQTFPHEFKFEGSKTELEQMIGNAVPVKLAEFVGRCLKEYIVDKAAGKVLSSHEVAQSMKAKQLQLWETK